MDDSKKRIIVYIAVGLVVAAGIIWFTKAQASDSTALSGANAGANSSSAAQSGSVSGAVGVGGAGGTALGAGFGGNGGSGGNASNAGNNQLIQFNSEAVDPGDVVPNVYAPALTTTLSGTCYGSASGGIGASGIGVSFGKTYQDLECQRRLNANQLMAIGLPNLAAEVMCETPGVLLADARMETPICARNIAAASIEPVDGEATGFNPWDSVPMASIDTEPTEAQSVGVSSVMRNR